MIQHRFYRIVRRSSTSFVALMALPIFMSFACSNGDVSLGEGRSTQDLVQNSRCSESSVLAADVFVTNQAELEALAGCEEIQGRLTIDIFEGLDLAPLASLRRVSSYFEVGTLPLFDRDPAAQVALEAVQESGILPSLQGLESLERVGSLQLNSLLVTDFTELESLRQIDETFHLYDLRNVTSLVGLEAVRTSRLEIGYCPKLETLDGFTFEEVSGGLSLDTLPALTSIDAYAGVGVVDGRLSIYGTGLESLPDLSLSSVLQLVIKGNPGLVDVSGLRTLSFANELRIVGNPLLKAFPAMPDLHYFGSLDVIGNGIETLALNFPALETLKQTIGNRTVDLPAERVVIASNPGLLHVGAPFGYQRVRNFLVYDNASLQDIDFGSLERADLLVIEENAVLDSVSLPSLAGVGTLEVTNNPKLVADVFDGLRTLERSIAGNAAP